MGGHVFPSFSSGRPATSILGDYALSALHERSHAVFEDARRDPREPRDMPGRVVATRHIFKNVGRRTGPKMSAAQVAANAGCMARLAAELAHAVERKGPGKKAQIERIQEAMRQERKRLASVAESTPAIKRATMRKPFEKPQACWVPPPPMNMPFGPAAARTAASQAARPTGVRKVQPQTKSTSPPKSR